MKLSKKNQSLNNLVIKYRTTRDDFLFTDIYTEVKNRLRNEGAYLSFKQRFNLSQDETEPIVDDVILESIEGYKDIGETYAFYNYFSSILSKKITDYARFVTREKRGGRQISETIEELQISPELRKFIPHANADNEDFDDYVKESEQRQLLTQLLGKADDKCRQAVEALLESKSYNDAAKKLGISNHAVKRRVQKVAKLFDTSIYGDIHDYFTVPTTPSNQLVSQPEVSAS